MLFCEGFFAEETVTRSCHSETGRSCYHRARRACPGCWSTRSADDPRISLVLAKPALKSPHNSILAVGTDLAGIEFCATKGIVVGTHFERIVRSRLRLWNLEDLSKLLLVWPVEDGLKVWAYHVILALTIILHQGFPLNPRSRQS
jgi:hypothetical protein